MGDANPIRTLGDYSKPSHEGYRNTFELPVGNNVCEIDRVADGKLRDKNADESWEIIENLALYDHEGWNDSNEFLKPIKDISTPLSTSKTPDQRLLELEDQINFLLKGERLTPRPSSTHIPQAYAEAGSQKMLIREEVKSPITKNLNSISLTREEEERNDTDDMAADGRINGTHTEMPIKGAEKETKVENETKNKPIKRAEREETTKASNSQPVGYYLKHRIDEKLIEGLVDNHRGPVYKAILRKKITRKEDNGGNFEIPCNQGGLKRMKALVDQGSDVNFMPLSTYMKLTDERPAETNIRLSLASHSYIYPLGIAEDVLVDVARIPESLCKVEKGIKNDIEPITPTMIVNRLVLE
nr:MAK10-like protein [Tanacetum cinerariifolium]